MEFDLENPLTAFKDEECNDVIEAALFSSELDHMPSFTSFKSTDLRLSIRREAFSVISEAQFYYGLDPVTAYLAVNFIDRFLSKQVVLEEKGWIVRILVIASFSLAAKIRSIELSISDLQGEEGFDFDLQSINRMETLILSTLRWRLRSITPFAFLNFFISSSEYQIDSPQVQVLKEKAVNVLINSQQEITLLEYRPSIIAASALLCVTYELFPLEFSTMNDRISHCEYVNKEELQRCWNLMEEMINDENEMSYSTVSDSTLTPISVLDRECASSQSENPSRSLRDSIKRRRLK